MTVMNEEEKREYIKTARDNLFVEAGAGAGKTTMLSDRIVNQIADGEPMRSFVVITFTKAAAQELLERITMTMRKRMEMAQGHDLEVLQDAMQRIDELHVSTIHSFCRTILMEYAFEAGFVLDPDMLEEEKESARMYAFFNEWKRTHTREIHALADRTERDWYRPLFEAFKVAASLRCPIALDDVPEEEWTDAELFMHTAVKIADAYHAYIDADALTMTNDQLLFKAGKLVRENDVICAKLREKYKHLYVDEFQDTDDIQADMIWKLAEKEPGVLRDNALFVVGDPKQSIYRFRGAQVELFYEIRERMEKAENASVLSLEANFRSDASIISYVNTVFERRIAEYTAMRTERHGPSPYTGVFRCSYEAEDDKGKKLRNDVRDVCDLVEMMEAVNESTRFGDFLIITKDKSKISEYVKVFAEKGIATAVRGKIDVESSTILNGFVHAYHAIADRYARLDQAAHAQLLSGMQYAEMTVEEKNAWLHELHLFAEEQNFFTLSAGGAARMLYDHPEMYMPKGMDLSSTELRSAKAKLLQCIDTCIANEQGGHREFAQAMLDYLKNEVPREIPLQPNEDAVAIMNVHQCKGLAGKIVIIADRRQAMKEENFDNLLMDGVCRPVFKAPKTAFQSETLVTYERHQELMDLNLQKRDEEWIRLEYVAATRARECMIFMKNQKEGAWFSHDDYDTERLPDIMDIVNSLRHHPGTHAKEESTDLNDDDLMQQTMADHQSIAELRRSWAVPSSLESSGNSGYGVNDTLYIHEDRPSQELFGTVLHRCFELLVNRRRQWLHRSTENCVVTVVMQVLMEYSDEIPVDETDRWEAFLKERLNAYCRNVLPALLEGAEEVHTEYPFVLKLHEGETRPEFMDGKKYAGELTITGTMDLVIVYEDGHVLIADYKSDARNGMELSAFRNRMAKKYRNQVALYAFALKKARGFDTVDTRLIDLYQC